MVIDIILALILASIVAGGVLWVHNILKPMNFRRDIAEPFMGLIIILIGYWPIVLVFITVVILSMWAITGKT